MTAPADDGEAMRRAGDSLAAGDLDGAVAHLSAAVRQLTVAGDTRAAAMACVDLGSLFQNALGNKVAARPWFTRAVRLVEHEEPCVEQGWAAVAPLGCDVDDPAALLDCAELALDRARRFGDPDLEVKALADGGLARVQAGQVSEGMAMIDEAMALACGGTAENPMVLGKSVCSFYTACYYTADFERVASWSHVLRQRGMLDNEPGPWAFLSSHCDSVRSTLLCHLGRWGEAEDLLVRAHTAIEAAMPGASWHTPIALAELRILQGRLAEAEALLLGRDDHIQALLPYARLHLARGDLDLACAVARRGMRVLAGDRVRAATLLGVLVEAELGRGDVVSAAAASTELDARTSGLGLPALDAEAGRLRARVRAAEGDHDAAVEALQSGLDRLAGVDLPLLAMTLHAELARQYEAAGDLAGAVVEARAAAALLGRLDVVVAPTIVDALGRLGVGVTQSTTPAVRCRLATLERDGLWWTAACGETRVRLRDTKGLAYLAAIVACPGVERHAIDLVDVVEGVSPDGIDRRNLGDAGALLDAASRTAYRRHLAELRDQVEDALDREDDDRAAALQAELDAVLGELARSLGIGGRERRASSVAEKARLNVTRALRSAITRLTDALPAAGATLDRRVRTGLFCAYEPHPDDEVTWSVVQS